MDRENRLTSSAFVSLPRRGHSLALAALSKAIDLGHRPYCTLVLSHAHSHCLSGTVRLSCVLCLTHLLLYAYINCNPRPIGLTLVLSLAVSRSPLSPVLLADCNLVHLTALYRSVLLKYNFNFVLNSSTTEICLLYLCDIFISCK